MRASPIRFTVSGSICGAGIASDFVFKIVQSNPPKTASATMAPLQLMPRSAIHLAPRQQDGENN